MLFDYVTGRVRKQYYELDHPQVEYSRYHVKKLTSQKICAVQSNPRLEVLNFNKVNEV